MTVTVYTLTEKPHLADQVDQLGAEAWPAFMLQGNGPHWPLLYDIFAPYQLLFCDPAGALVAVGHTVPLVWDGTLADLPPTIDAIIVRAEHAHLAGQAPNTFSALAAVVSLKLRGQNLSRAILLEMKALARRHACTSLIAPVRPTLKSSYPLTPMERYVEWKRPDGAPFDPWMRVHWRLGAETLGLAWNTMTVINTVKNWEQWTGMAFPESGPYVVPGALQPIEIDCERDSGRYEDPNVWMRHPIGSD